MRVPLKGRLHLTLDTGHMNPISTPHRLCNGRIRRMLVKQKKDASFQMPGRGEAGAAAQV